MPDDSAAAIRKLQDELIGYQRQALLGAAAAMMAHEFNNLMTPVLARAQDAVARDDVPAMRKALTVTVSQTQKAIDITRRLLELARDGSVSSRTCNLRSAVEDAVAAGVRPVVKDGIDLEIAVPDGLDVRAEPILLEQVLLNLLNHARTGFSERGGRIAVRASSDNGMVLIDVADNNPASPRERIETVLAPFLAADMRREPCDWQGVGHGWNVCRMIVQLHGGRMEARPAESGGCLIRVFWPAA